MARSEDRLRLRAFLFPFVFALAFAASPWRVVGRDRLPRSGGFLVVANHASWMDPPWIALALRLPIRYLTKHTIFEAPVVGGMARITGAFPVRRGEADRRALEAALGLLRRGQIVGFFPEGHRSEDGTLLQARPGVGLLALRSGVPIVPVAIVGSRGARLGRFWRRDIEIRVGEPFRVSESEAQPAADEIMRRIAALLPAEMRGQYATEPDDGGSS